jgi:hypothetical protein
VQSSVANWLFLETIAHTAHRLNPTSGESEFLSQSENLHVHGTFCNGSFLTVNSIENLLTSKHPTRVLCQEVEQLEFYG